MELANYVSFLRRCASARSLLEGMRIHNDIVANGHEQDCDLQNCLIRMYGHCGYLENANDVFVHLHERNIYSWTIMIGAFVENDCAVEGLQVFQQMEQQGTIPNHVSFITILSGCVSQTALGEGRKIHARIVARVMDVDIVVSTSLINMYSKCGSLDESWKVFDKMDERNEVSWNAMITGFIREGKYKAALELFHQMQLEGSLPTRITFVTILGSLDILRECKHMHASLIAANMSFDVVVGTVLVNLYAKMANLDEARRVFEVIPEPNTLSWSAMIGATLRLGKGSEALMLFQQMLMEGCFPGKFNFATILTACADEEAIAHGLQIHALIVGCYLQDDLVVGNALINMYGKAGKVEDARMLFMSMPCHDLVSWNSLLAALVQEEQNKDVCQLFQQMRLEGVMPDNVSLATVLSSCACEESLAEGRRMHATIIAGGFSADHFLSTSLVTMYGKSGDLENALRVFDKTERRDVVIWTAIITSCAQHGLSEKALHLYQQMQLEGVLLNKATYMSVLDACASQTTLREGMRIDSGIFTPDTGSHISVNNALINMYTRCGNLKEAWEVFKDVSKRDVVSWTSMIAGLARLGHGKEAHQLFLGMSHDNILPNKVTFINIIDACSHAGLVDEGYYYFSSMRNNYDIAWELEHYNCMVDLVGRAGRLHDGEALLLLMPFSPPPLLWLTLLSACKSHMDMELANYAAHRLLTLEPESDVPYALLSNIHAAIGEWEHVSNLRMLAKGLKEQSSSV